MASLPVCDFSDEPRVTCTCAEHKAWKTKVWNAEFPGSNAGDDSVLGDLTDAEHEYFGSEEFLAQVQAAHRAQVTLKPLPLSGKKATPWVEPIKVKGVAKAGPECEVCHDNPRGDAFVCSPCMAEVRAMLDNLSNLMHELDVKAERLDRTHSGNAVVDIKTMTPWDQKFTSVYLDQGVWHSVDSDDPMRDFDAVAESMKVLSAAGYTKRGYALGAERAQQNLDDAVCQLVIVVADKGMDMLRASVWLAENPAALAKHPTAPKLVAALKRAYSRAMSQIDNVATGTFLGYCQGEYTEGRICRAPLYANLAKHADDPTQITCPRPSCGRVYDIKVLWSEKNALLDNEHLTIDGLVTLSTQDKNIFGRVLSKSTLAYWVKTGKLKSLRGKIVNDSVVNLYPVLDVKEISRKQFRRAA